MNGTTGCLTSAPSSVRRELRNVPSVPFKRIAQLVEIEGISPTEMKRVRNFEGQERGSKITRTYEFHLIAYFLSRYGSSTGVGQVNPPEILGAAGWNEAYDYFYDAINGGRDQQTFRRSLKNARDSYDSHSGESGRVGWRETDTARSPARLSKMAIQVVEDWETRTPDDFFKRISELVRNVQANNKRELPPVRAAQLEGGKSVRKRAVKRGGRGDRPYIIGKEAEEWVLDYLIESLGDSIQSLRHHPIYGETPGYDISYIDEFDQKQAIEVKGTTAPNFTSFELTDNEFRAAKQLGANYTIWLITNVGNNPIPFKISDPCSELERGNLEITPSEWLVQGFSTV